MVMRVFKGDVIAAETPYFEEEKYFLIISRNEKNASQRTVLALKINSKQPAVMAPTILQVPRQGPSLKSLYGWIDCEGIFEIYNTEITRKLAVFPPVFMNRVNDSLKIVFDIP